MFILPLYEKPHRLDFECRVRIVSGNCWSQLILNTDRSLLGALRNYLETNRFYRLVYLLARSRPLNSASLQ